MAVKPANPKYVAKPYKQMERPGQRIQIDVKFVPSVCLVNEAKGQIAFMNNSGLSKSFFKKILSIFYLPN